MVLIDLIKFQIQETLERKFKEIKFSEKNEETKDVLKNSRKPPRENLREEVF